MPRVGLLLLSAVMVVVAGRKASDPSYDHQTKTYNSFASPSTCTETATHVTPFFSPDSSIQTYVELIDEAVDSIDLYTPGKKLSYPSVLILWASIAEIHKIECFALDIFWTETNTWCSAP